MKRVIYQIAALALLACFCVSALRANDPNAGKAKAADQEAEKEKKAKAKVLALEKAKVVAAAQNDAQVQQWVNQFRPVLTSELAFIRQMCDLSKEQRPKIKAAGEASLLDAAKQFADSQQRRQPGPQFDPRPVIRDTLAKALAESLPAEQMTRFQEEWAARAAQRKRAAILSVVSRLDGTLCLTDAQRDKISESLKANWQDRHEQWLVMHQYGDMYFPVIDDKTVSAFLDNEQKSVWTGLQKVDFGFYGGQGNQQQDDAEWWDGGSDKPLARPGVALPAAVKALGNWLKGNR